MRIYLIAPAPDDKTDTAAETGMTGVKTPFTLSAAAGIVSVAAWLPRGTDIRICDEVVQEVDLGAEIDPVGLSINVSQLVRGLDLARAFRRRGVPVVLGGAHVSLVPEIFRGRADCLVIGGFETAAPDVAADLPAGALKPEYRCGKADMAAMPLPRRDLYPNDRVIAGVVQTSRGCPFDGTFCDVIQYVGRKQRHKPPEKVLAEPDQLYRLGYREVSLSDDNFAVSRKRTRALLEALIGCNGSAGRDPVRFSPQISIDADLLALCNRAGLRQVVVGLETSAPAALAEANKRQNLHVGLIGKCRKLVAAGLTIRGGLIAGFDHDDLGCFERQFAFAQALPVDGFNVSAPVAPYATPLYAEMKRAGRIADADTHRGSAAGARLTNMLPAQMTREELAEGRALLKAALLAPDAALVRFEAYARTLAPPSQDMGRTAWVKPGARRHPLHELLPLMMKEKGTRRVILAVREMIAERPETGYDLTSTLTLYLSECARAANRAEAPLEAAQ
ncbi:B12-binding domain-containing radical SAM protein [Rhodovulum sulfidophilum]|uniref:B12-binding domain-containing radical SAM protein n=1 Tax=Rhodovulum sulfidophilum TaxID=35806 RepID=UPI001927A1AE|nr:radical SAM protein [Rhodovulum sulfidophilum]MBL3585129.1 B12-binding domain-containing radical SAM protein [Rhodovulum sulfidophilum]